MKWVESPRFTGKRTWRWEGVVEWGGENVPVSVWHDSTQPTRAGSEPDAKLLAVIEKRLARALKKHWPQKRVAEAMFSRLRTREWKSAPPVTAKSLGVPTLSLPNGVKMPRVDLEFRACRVFGASLFPTVKIEDGMVWGSLRSVIDDKGRLKVGWDEQKHSVVPRVVTEPRPALLPPRAKWKSVKKLEWFKAPTVVMAGGWRVKVRGEGVLGLAVGTLADFMRLAAEVLAVTHAEGGWSVKRLPAMKLLSKLRPLELSLDGASWTWLFHCGSAFAGHRAEVWADGQTLNAELVG